MLKRSSVFLILLAASLIVISGATFHHFKVAAGQELKKQVPSSSPLIKKPLPSLNSETSDNIMERLMEIQKQQNKESQAERKERRAALTSTPLTGEWHAADGGIYYLRQIGNILWWNGMSGGNDGRTFNNVFRIGDAKGVEANISLFLPSGLHYV